MSQPPLGYITPAERTRAQEIAHADAMNAMLPRFRVTPTAAEPDTAPRVDLMSVWKHPKVVQALGFEFPGVHQVTGSCVGAGGGNVLFTLAAIEVLRLNDPEQIILPFWLHSYGISRLLLGDRSEGEGSLGSTFAQAVTGKMGGGVLDNATDGLPKPENTDGLVWGERTEMKWSNGAAIEKKWTEAAGKHLVRSTAPIRSSDELRTALRNWYPVTFACNWFINPGTEKLAGSKEPVMLGKLNGQGGHQTSQLQTWDHPELGLIFFDPNQWGLNVYKQDPATGLRLGTWLPAGEIDRAIRSGDAEIFAFSQFDGFPAQARPWADLYSW